MKNLFDLEGKVAVVTGGSRGIGAMIARGFVENGVKTYITARRAEELQATADELSALGECIDVCHIHRLSSDPVASCISSHLS